MDGGWEEKEEIDWEGKNKELVAVPGKMDQVRRYGTGGGDKWQQYTYS